jgi:hypothetical protein
VDDSGVCKDCRFAGVTIIGMAEAASHASPEHSIEAIQPDTTQIESDTPEVPVTMLATGSVEDGLAEIPVDSEVRDRCATVRCPT